MSNAPKKMPAISADHRNEPGAAPKNGEDALDFARRKGEPGIHGAGNKPIHITQKEAQSIVADKDPDDPVSR